MLWQRWACGWVCGWGEPFQKKSPGAEVQRCQFGDLSWEPLQDHREGGGPSEFKVDLVFCEAGLGLKFT